MKYIILVAMLFQLNACVTMSAKDKQMQRYYCTRNFVQHKVPFNDASGWCGKNFRNDLEE